MTTKTITITEEAYEALQRKKEKNESFSKLILRTSNKKPLSDFFGILSEESANKLEKTIKELRKKRNLAHKKRMKKIIEELNQ